VILLVGGRSGRGRRAEARRRVSKEIVSSKMGIKRIKKRKTRLEVGEREGEEGKKKD
jgi:hypothetical protein